MTKNQIEYNKLLESRRTNMENERIRDRANEISFSLGTSNLDETQRHNRVVEGLQSRSLDETVRSNLANEQLKASAQVEQQRSNRANEALTLRQRIEQARSNQAQERLKEMDILHTDERAKQQVSLGYSQLGESARSNRAQESLTASSQGVAQVRNQIDQARVDESIRHNQAVERETNRANVVREQQQAKQIITNAFNQTSNTVVNSITSIAGLATRIISAF